MNRSESIKELATALCKAQAVIEGAAKDKSNPAFKTGAGGASKYADLASCWEAARKPLTDNGLSVMQFPRLTDNGVEVETMLMHISGEYLGETLTVPLAKRDAHGVGSAITYGRRFSLCALVGISPEDDDGNAAAKKGNGHDEQNDVTRTISPSGSARGVLQASYEAMDDESKKWLGNISSKLTALLKAEGPVAAVDYIDSENLTTEDKMGLWFLLDSTTRSTIKREQERRLNLKKDEKVAVAA